MESFKPGDYVECVDFSGVSGKSIKMTGRKTFVVKAAETREGKTYLYLEDVPFGGVYATRFELAHPPMHAPEMDLDEIHLAQEIIDGL